MPTKNSKSAVIEREVDEQEQDQEQEIVTIERVPHNLNLPNPKITSEPKKITWVEAKELSFRGVPGSIFTLVRPHEYMYDPDYRVVYYATPHIKDSNYQVEIEFDANYPAAYLVWALEDLRPSDYQLDELIEEYKGWAEKEKLIALDAELRRTATAIHESKGKDSKGVDYYFNQLKSLA